MKIPDLKNELHKIKIVKIKTAILITLIISILSCQNRNVGQIVTNPQNETQITSKEKRELTNKTELGNKKMKEKYPDEYFEHFIAMFNEILSEETLKNHLSLAKAMEGIDYIIGLKEELQLMELNNDQKYFIELAKEKGVENFAEKHFKILINEATLILK
jgi:hypothetical protein